MAGFKEILTFSHLRWDFVYQRPQQLLSRFAARHGHRVLFIEEPIYDEPGRSFWERSEPEPGVLIYRPHTPERSPGFSGAQTAHLKRLITQLLEEEKPGAYCLWLYTPMALPLTRGLEPRAIVYDCMDELSSFRNAPAELPEREDELFGVADLVFTGGPSLFRAKRGRHPNVHCFPSSVDIRHYSKARDGIPEPADQTTLPHPRLGFFGVIDERLDIGLLDALGRSRPEWQIVMIGPVVKIDPAGLPRYPNIHYLGMRDYAALPAYLAGWDVCLMPFALNEATRFISPTKVLEYMASERMIVSTPITDIAEPYGDSVYLGGTPEEFIAGCERALTATVEERNARVRNMRSVLARTSWDKTAGAMHELVNKAADRRIARTSRVEKRRIVIAGAGPTGLSAAYHLGEDSLLIEQNDRVGGWCRSIEDRGFTFDFAGHILFSNEPYVHQLYKVLLGGNVHWQDREAWIYSKGVYTRYPFQGALYGLPPQVIKECIVGAIEARFGPLKSKSETATKANGSGKANGAQCKAESITDCCGDGVMESTAELVAARIMRDDSAQPANFEEFIQKVWGAGIARHFALPYNQKLWTVPLSEMETSWLGGRVPLPDLEEMIEGALQPVSKPMGPNARFGYPLRGGFQALMDGFLPHLKGKLCLNTRVIGVSAKKKQAKLSDGSTVPFDYFINTIPLPVLVRLLGDEAPPEVQAAAARLRFISVRCVNIGVGRERLTDKHWIYYPEDTVFHRIFVQGNASPFCNPPGGFGLTCEITYAPTKPLPCEGDELIQRCIADCRKVGLIGPSDPIWTANQVDLSHAYVIYDHARSESVRIIRDWLEARDILLAGRYSEWEYYNSDHAFIAGKRAAERIRTCEAERIGLARAASSVAGELFGQQA